MTVKAEASGRDRALGGGFEGHRPSDIYALLRLYALLRRLSQNRGPHTKKLLWLCGGTPSRNFKISVKSVENLARYCLF